MIAKKFNVVSFSMDYNELLNDFLSGINNIEKTTTVKSQY